MTQCEKILLYMKLHGEITARDAIEFGCYRLSARIYDLKKAGYNIVSRSRTVKNRDGSTTHIEVYSLEN